MRIAIFSNKGDASRKVSAALYDLINKTDLVIDGLNPDIVITVGGDGTLLSAFHHYIDRLKQIRFVGIHTGHLGFYTDWRDYEVKELINSLVHDDGQSVSYPLLDVKVDYLNDNQSDSILALNESTIKRPTNTMQANIFIKGEFFESFRGDGLCISTPTGSTAYNKSVGGAIINPKFDAIQVTEIASINNRVFRTIGSPLILPEDEWLRVEPETGDNDVVTCDQLTISDRPIKSISYRISQQRISFAQYRHTQFWKRVSGSFIGEEQHD
ncbi:NAD kinase [Secundilactobacillus malefermentans]|uniref:NAD kinase n=1 Tax=Secundilactobacillus malefermentans TaxID=176292 RepID=A0A4R5NTH8_9LACO|nr:NAD kinase [Secundilactobacillus malefermentans]KRM58517.1 inorganic polyphosphate ATP-NAD kinase [Secundilactobacillus malefermentans DSM 5705 = KCTC 3548]QEA30896.1 NAD kinase [Secundilactobacillus malefermentans]TDG80647.1 hypothetical protein C5L31_001223 [Secundilactobacillus malefermentans]